jgi:hypothetical protein
VRIKSKRGLKEIVRLLVTRGTEVEESRNCPKLVFRAEDVGADKWIAPGVCCPWRVLRSFGAVWGCVLLTMSEMLWMTFAEVSELMHQALGFVHSRKPEV